MSGWIVDGLDLQALAAYLHLSVKVVALGDPDGGAVREPGLPGMHGLVRSRSVPR